MRHSKVRSSIYINDNKEKSIIYLNKKYLNQNLNNINENLKKEKNHSHRLIQSSIDISINNLNSSINKINSHRHNGIIRIESALITSDYSHLLHPSLVYASQPIIDRNMNRTIDLIKQNELEDKNLSFHSNDKEVKTSSTTDNSQYLVLEQVHVNNRRKIQFTSKQFILICISVFVCVVVISLIMILL